MRIGTLRKVIGDDETGLDDCDSVAIRIGGNRVRCVGLTVEEVDANGTSQRLILEPCEGERVADQRDPEPAPDRDHHLRSRLISAKLRSRFIGAKIEVQMHHNDCSQGLVLRIQRLDTDALEWLLRICEFGEVAIDCSGAGKWLYEHLRDRGLRCAAARK